MPKIDLESNKIRPEGAKHLAEALKVNKALTKISLSFNNRIGPEGAKHLAEALKVNTTLTKINVCHDVSSQTRMY